MKLFSSITVAAAVIGTSFITSNPAIANNGCYAVAIRDASGPSRVSKGRNVNIVGVDKEGNLILYKRGGPYKVVDFSSFSAPCKNIGL